MPICRAGQDTVDPCRGGSTVTSVCRGGEELLLAPITATFTYAPTTANLGGADPTSGTLTELDDAPGAGAPSGGLNKGLYAVVSGITGGDGGPYTVNFAGLSWQIDEEAGFTQIDNIALHWAANQNLLGVAATPNQLVAVAGSMHSGLAPIGASVPGVVASTGYAMFTAQIRAGNDPTPAFGGAYEFVHSMGAGTVTVTDGSGNSATITAPAITDEWFATP